MTLNRTGVRTLALPAIPALAAGAALAAGVLVAMPLPAYAVVTAAEMQDLPPDHWAYKAIRDLAERYGVMEGFPDKTFRGTKNVTRYELAAALAKVMQRMDQLAKAAPAAGTAPVATPKPAVPAADAATVAKLKTEFKTELDAMSARVEKSENALKDLQDSLGKLVKVGGSVRAQYADDTLDQGKDRSAPFISTALTLKFKGKVSDSTSYDTAIRGTVKASGSGDVPGPMGGGSGPSADTLSINTARFTAKVGATTVNVGRFPLWLVGFGPYTDQAFNTGDFVVGLGALSQDVSNLRTGSDVGATLDTKLGPVSIQGGVNSNIVIGQVAWSMGPVAIKGAYETDHKAITQNLFNTGQRIKTTDNAAVVVDFGGEGPLGATVEANLTNRSLTGVGGGVRWSVGDWGVQATSVMSSDPGKSVSVLSYAALVSVPSFKIGPISTPTALVSALDNYTIDAPPRPDGKPTVGPGGQALGKNAGFSVQVNLDNPFIPNLVAEYNAQAKLIEGIFAPTPDVPITSETIVLQSTLSF